MKPSEMGNAWQTYQMQSPHCWRTSGSLPRAGRRVALSRRATDVAHEPTGRTGRTVRTPAGIRRPRADRS